MPWERRIDGGNAYDGWDEGEVHWSIQDLDPAEDEKVTDLFLKYFVPDENIFSRFEIMKQPKKLEGMIGFWKSEIAKRTSLVCYRYEAGEKEIAAVNICSVKSIDDATEDSTKEDDMDDDLSCLVNTVNYMSDKADLYETMDVREYLTGYGLLVVPKFRGNRLGAKVLAARESMCRLLGVKGTATLFTGVASQKLAARAGFTTAVDMSFAELADLGFVFPGNPHERIKLMKQRYLH